MFNNLSKEAKQVLLFNAALILFLLLLILALPANAHASAGDEVNEFLCLLNWQASATCK